MDIFGVHISLQLLSGLLALQQLVAAAFQISDKKKNYFD